MHPVILRRGPAGVVNHRDFTDALTLKRGKAAVKHVEASIGRDKDRDHASSPLTTLSRASMCLASDFWLMALAHFRARSDSFNQ